ncbi:hypothetical protein [Tabrizicola sp.]|uniref:hypothetical protein n=1 Tax=Tabrizicola sp. TaxID=2005166 RepID=UPI0035B04996
MKRRAFLSGLVAGVALAGPALAQGLVDDIVGQLRRQGFRSVVTERTLLGRVRIVASRADGSREIIVNPRTGEILRDLWSPKSGGKGNVEIIEDNSGKGSGGSGHDDDDDDDDDDHSGKGGGDNSGSGGSSGSGGGDDSDDDDDDDDDDD